VAAGTAAGAAATATTDSAGMGAGTGDPGVGAAAAAAGNSALRTDARAPRVDLVGELLGVFTVCLGGGSASEKATV
jgi:hypothetical protein